MLLGCPGPATPEKRLSLPESLVGSKDGPAMQRGLTAAAVLPSCLNDWPGHPSTPSLLQLQVLNGEASWPAVEFKC